MELQVARLQENVQLIAVSARVTKVKSVTATEEQSRSQPQNNSHSNRRTVVIEIRDKLQSNR